MIDKLLHFGKVFPEREIEHSGAEKVIDLHNQIEAGAAASDILVQHPESSDLVEAQDVGAEEDDSYVEWAIAVLEPLKVSTS